MNNQIGYVSRFLTSWQNSEFEHSVFSRARVHLSIHANTPEYKKGYASQVHITEGCNNQTF